MDTTTNEPTPAEHKATKHTITREDGRPVTVTVPEDDHAADIMYAALTAIVRLATTTDTVDDRLGQIANLARNATA